MSDINKVGYWDILPRHLNIITDARNAVFEFEVTDVPIIVNMVKDNIARFSSVNEALIQDSPFVTALSMIYQYQLSTFDNFNFKIFSTLEGGYNWLNK